MKRWWNLGAALTLALAVTACAGDRATETESEAAGRPATGDTVGTSGESERNIAEERQFLEEQLAVSLAEIELGQLAEQRGTHPEVKRFGDMMVREHRAAREELERLSTNLASSAAGAAAGREPGERDTVGTSGRETAEPADTARNRDLAGTSGTTDMRNDHRELVEELKQASGNEFDRKYIDRMVEDHEKAVNEVEDRAENAANPEIRQWAARTLPKMQQHLERAKMIQETLENSGGR